MKNFTMEDLKRLTAVEGEVCISMYMPTDPSAATTDEQRIRFKNLLRRAEKTVQERAPKNKQLVEMIEKGRRLLENDYFWRYQSDGLAVFIAPDVFLFYRLPIAFEEVFSASNRFAVKPLMPMFMADARFYILALSQAEVRLFDCTPHNVMEIDLVDVPDGIAESLRYDSKQYQLQFHTGTAGGGRRPAMFHGHGVGTDDKKDEILRYFQDVNRGLATILPDRQVPLVLAGVDYLLPIFRYPILKEILIAIISLLVMILMSILITRVATIALTQMGLTKASAKFQARSAFSVAGFTTSESEIEQLNDAMLSLPNRLYCCVKAQYRLNRKQILYRPHCVFILMARMVSE